jgi:hypothetical protein
MEQILLTHGCHRSGKNEISSKSREKKSGNFSTGQGNLDFLQKVRELKKMSGKSNLILFRINLFDLLWYFYTITLSCTTSLVHVSAFLFLKFQLVSTTPAIEIH